MDICVSREVYLVQISSPFDAVKSLIEKKSFFGYVEFLCSLNSVWSIFEEFVLVWLVLSSGNLHPLHTELPPKAAVRGGLNCLGLGQAQGFERAQWCQSNCPDSVLAPTINLAHKIPFK